MLRTSTPPHTPLSLEAGTIGTRFQYTAPEILAGNDHSFKSDVYSFGMLVLECLTPGLAWAGAAVGADAERWPTVPKNAPRDLRAVVNACCLHDPASRPPLERIVFRRGGGGGGSGGRGGGSVVIVSETYPDAHDS